VTLSSRLVRLMLRLSRETGTAYEDLVVAARELARQNPKLTPDDIDRLLRRTG
jgi:hypothetical protein